MFGHGTQCSDLGVQSLLLLLGALLLGFRLLSREGLLRGGREVGGADSRLGRRLGSSLGGSRSSSDQLLSLGGVVTYILLRELGSLGCVLAGDLAKLLGLSMNNIANLLKVMVDKLLVVHIDQGRKENDGGAQQGQDPVGDDLDKIV